MTPGTRLASFPMGIGMAGAGLLAAFLVAGMIPRILPLPVWIGVALVVILAGVGIGGGVLFAWSLVRGGMGAVAAVLMTLFAAAFLCGGTFLPVWYALAIYQPTITP